jgi:hypothetical protein
MARQGGVRWNARKESCLKLCGPYQCEQAEDKAHTTYFFIF